MTLYDIDQALLDLMENVDPETGEWIGDPEAWEALNLARETKLDNTACLIKDIRGDIKKIEAELKSNQERLKAKLNALKRKEAWLMGNLERSLGGEPFETERCSVKFKKNPEAVRFEDEQAVLDWAIEYRQDLLRYAKPTLSREEIKALLRQGEQIPGAALVREIRMEVK